MKMCLQGAGEGVTHQGMCSDLRECPKILKTTFLPNTFSDFGTFQKHKIKQTGLGHLHCRNASKSRAKSSALDLEERPSYVVKSKESRSKASSGRGLGPHMTFLQRDLINTGDQTGDLKSKPSGRGETRSQERS